MNPAEPPVLTRVQGGVAHLLLNRPAARNTITLGLARALHDALSDAAVYADLIVLRGAGGHFCAGSDVGETARLRDQGPDAVRPLVESFLGACRLIGELPVPVVAVVEGTAVAAGFDLVQSVDIAIVRDDALLADRGADSSPRLLRLVGAPRAMGHLLTGDRISGRQAAEWGLVYRSAPPAVFEREVAALIGNLEGRDRAALAHIKQLVRAGGAAESAAPLDLVGRHAGAGSGRATGRRGR